MPNDTAKNVANVVYALVVGLAAASIAVLGPLVVAFVATWAFNYIGWTRSRDVAAKVPAYFAIIIIFGVAVGLTTCLRMLGRRFSKDAQPPTLK